MIPQRTTPYAARVSAAIARARRAGHTPRPPTPMTGPEAATRAYAARLTTMVRSTLLEAYKPLLASLPTLVAQARQERGDAIGWRADASSAGRSASASVASASRSAASGMSAKRIAAAAAAAADDAGAHVGSQLGRQVKDVLGIDLMPDTKAKARAHAFIHENVKLITGITPALAAEVESVLLAGLSGGQLHEMLALAIKSKLQVSINRAELIAVDQLGKLSGQIAAARAQDLGATHFYWRTAEDERVRGNPAGKYPKALPSHYARNGQRYAYAEPPLGKKGEKELPGVPIRCRCYGEPDLTTVPGFQGVAEEAAAITGTPEDVEAEAARLLLEVEKMLAGQSAPPPPATPALATVPAPAAMTPKQVAESEAALVAEGLKAKTVKEMIAFMTAVESGDKTWPGVSRARALELLDTVYEKFQAQIAEAAAAKPAEAEAPGPFLAMVKQKQNEGVSPPETAPETTALVALPAPKKGFAPEKIRAYNERAFRSLPASRKVWEQHLESENPAAGDTSVYPGMSVDQRSFVQMRAAYSRSLPPAQRDAAIFYSYKGDRVLNSALREGRLADDPRVEEMARNLDAAIAAHVLPVDITVARGIKGAWAKKFADALNPGDVFQDLGYTSTAATAPFEGTVRLSIRVPAGTPAAPIPSRYPEESEFLLPRGTKFRVLGKRTTSEGITRMDLVVVP